MSACNVYDLKTGAVRLPVDAAPVNDPPVWAVHHPVAPDYASGCASGKAASLAYLKYLQSPVFSGGLLQRLALDWAFHLEAAKTPGERDGVQGKMVGFFSELERWLIFAANHASTDELRNATPASIQAALQDAAEGGPMTRMKAREKAERSEQARKAARARWDKKMGLKMIAPNNAGLRG